MAMAVGMLRFEPRLRIVIMVSGLIRMHVIKIQPHGDIVVSLRMMDVRYTGEGAESEPERTTSDCQNPLHP